MNDEEKYGDVVGYFSIGGIFEHSCPMCGSHDIEPIPTVNRIEKYHCTKCDGLFGVKRVIAGARLADDVAREILMTRLLQVVGVDEEKVIQTIHWDMVEKFKCTHSETTTVRLVRRLLNEGRLTRKRVQGKWYYRRSNNNGNVSALRQQEEKR